MNILRRLHLDGFVVALLIVVAIATLLPAGGQAAVVLGWITKLAIGLLFLLYGARLSPAEALQGVQHWRLHLTVLLTTFAAFPLLGLGLRILTPWALSDVLYTGLLFCCLVPSTVQSSIAFTAIARGNVAGAMVSASFSNLLGVVVTPALTVLLISRTALHGQAIDGSAVLDIVLQLLVPFLLGQLLRPVIGRWVKAQAKPLKLVDRGSILLVVYAAFSAGMQEGIWSKVSLPQLGVLVVVCVLALAIVLALTWYGSGVLGFSYADRIVVLFCGSKKSLASGLPMAAVLFAGQQTGLIILPLMLFHQIQLIVCAVIAGRLGLRATNHSGTVGTSG